MRSKPSHHSFSIPVSHIVRFMQACDNKVKECYINLQKNTSFRKTYIPPTLSTRAEQILRSGVFYIHGRDKAFRPAMIFEAVVLNHLDIPKEDLLPEAIRAIVFMLEYMIKNVFLPG